MFAQFSLFLGIAASWSTTKLFQCSAPVGAETVSVMGMCTIVSFWYIDYKRVAFKGKKTFGDCSS